MHSNNKIITIDGYSASGKSTIANIFAKKINFVYCDTGSIYRAITWKLLKEKISLRDIDKLNDFLSKFKYSTSKGRYFVGEIDVTNEIRNNDVNEFVSTVATLKSVRESIKPIQVAISKNSCCVFEGRDLGTNIFPNADLKFFLSARLEIRAKRRFKEMKDRVSLDAIMENIKKRDFIDCNRALSPLKKAEDAIFVDTSDLTIDECVDILISNYHKEVLN